MAQTPDMTYGAKLSIITDDDGVDTAEEWSQFFEGKGHSCAVSSIHLSTVRDDEGPPLHFHPYPEVIVIRRGRSSSWIVTSGPAVSERGVPGMHPGAARGLDP